MAASAMGAISVLSRVAVRAVNFVRLILMVSHRGLTGRGRIVGYASIISANLMQAIIFLTG